MLRILFVYTNINGFHEDTYSFGLASIISMTRANGYECCSIVVKEEDDCEKLLEITENIGINVIAFSSVSSQFNFIKNISADIKLRYPGILTVCGGVHPTINPNCILEAKHLDAIFIGESEYAFVDFLNKVDSGEDYRTTDNLAYAVKDKLIKNRLKPLISNLDILPYPDREIYPFADTLESVGYVPFLFSRGCPYMCSYCSNHAIAKIYGLNRNNIRYRSPESSIKEMEDVMSKFDVKIALIADDIFGIDKSWRREFCEKFKKRVNVKFVCLLRANIIDEEFIILLKDTGCYRISIGIESGNDYVRNHIMNRNMSYSQITNAFELAHKYGLETNAINIIGVPGESEEAIWDTIRLNRRINPTSSGVNIFYPYKGTNLGDYCFKKGLVDENAYSSFSNERRDTVLLYPVVYKKKLSQFYNNWSILIYPFSLKRRLKKLLIDFRLWKYLYGFRLRLNRCVKNICLVILGRFTVR